MNPAAWVAWVWSCKGCWSRSMSVARATSARVRRGPSPTCGKSRAAASKLSIPHNPQPTGPAMKRRRAASASARSARSQKRASSPFGCSASSYPSNWSGAVTMPSDSANPVAKSCKSAGVAIMTAALDPSKTMATATSSGKVRCTATARSGCTDRPGWLLCARGAITLPPAGCAALARLARRNPLAILSARSRG